MAENTSQSDDVHSPDRIADEPLIPYEPLIPFRQSSWPEEHGLYLKLRVFVRNRSPDQIPRVVVITDVEQDYDDLLAIIFLIEMHRMGAIHLEGCIANHYPADRRAWFLRTVLDLFNLPEVPVTEGTKGASDVEAHAPDLFYGLKNKTFEEAGNRRVSPFRNGLDLLNALVQESGTGRPPKQKLTVLLISSLQDISELFDDYKTTDAKDLQAKIHKCVSQGGYKWEDGVLWPEMGMVNNSFNRKAAKNYTRTIQESKIPSDAWSREAAKASALDGKFFKKLFGLGPIGAHLKWMWLRQEFKFYWDSNNDPFMPHLNFGWYLNTRLGLPKGSEKYNEWINGKPPRFRAVYPHIRIIPYDCCAAVGAVGDDFMRAMGVLGSADSLPDYNKTKPCEHRMFGRSPDDLGGINPSQLAKVMETFLHGALLATHKKGEQHIHAKSVEHYTQEFTEEMGEKWDHDSHDPLFIEIKESWKELSKCKAKALDAEDSCDLARRQCERLGGTEVAKVKVKEAEEAKAEADWRVVKAEIELKKVQAKVKEDQESPSGRLRGRYDYKHQKSFTAPYEWLYQKEMGGSSATVDIT
ncbi:hypothetical protein QBC35DRAFT_297302 [Podospora australis]|uniref:Uncharacterized protein n=1 Tax=Podospora australis TaxID=1536484 RepID=A0AAN6WQR8_9PEZI|nr:hypothetical protein QBC35DRAFT_297302 [Podospora australis]